MKNRGFAITGILYSILVLFLILLALLVFSLQNKKTILDRLKSNTMDEIEGVVKGKSSDNSGVTIDTTDQYSSTGVKQLGLKGVVYLDPTDLSKHCNADNSTIGSGTSGCMKWYIYDDSDNNYKMILDHNTENGVVWNSSGVNVAYASSGAYTSIQNLVTNNNWDSSLNTTIITVAEINAITEKTGFDTTNVASYYFFTNPNKAQTPAANSKGASKYAWLYDYTNDCASYGCNVSTSGTGDYGYWTQDPVGTASSGTAVWLVDRNDSLYPIDANHGSRGVRPVITISKSDVNTNLCVYDENHEFTFDYTGGVQFFITPCSGNYKLEVWGAQGGSYDSTYIGGKGGYSSGNINLTYNDVLSIVVGSQPASNKVLGRNSGTTCGANYGCGSLTGGYNGGGNGVQRGDCYMQSGGGATHIALNNPNTYTTLASYQTPTVAQNYVLMVAGGGGGGAGFNDSRYGIGGSGGGTTGGNGRYNDNSNCESYGMGGSQTSGGSYYVLSGHAYASYVSIPNAGFGYGGNADAGVGGSGGGAGWYGGRGTSCLGGGGGGSGYLSSNLSNANMENGIREGNGYAKITYLGD